MFVHEVNPAVIASPEVAGFYSLYLPQRRILADFYTLLPGNAWAVRIVNAGESRLSDSPRESLAHILAVQQCYLRGIRTGTLTFDDMPDYGCLDPTALLAEFDRQERDMYDYFTGDDFAADGLVNAPWGEMRAGNALFLLRDHDILHVGWNLAIMDLVGMARFPSLREHWG